MDFDSHSPNEHAHYAELCALFSSGALTKPEEEELNAHLDHCKSCKKLLRTYCALAKSGVTLLAPLYQREPAAVEHFLAIESAKVRLLERIQIRRCSSQC